MSQARVISQGETRVISREDPTVPPVLTTFWRVVVATAGQYEALAITTQAAKRRWDLPWLPRLPTISDWWEDALFSTKQPPAVHWALRGTLAFIAGGMIDHLYRKNRCEVCLVEVTR